MNEIKLVTRVSQMMLSADELIIRVIISDIGSDEKADSSAMTHCTICCILESRYKRH